MNPSKSSNPDLFIVKWIDDPQAGPTDQPMKDPKFVMALGINFPELRPSLCLLFFSTPIQCLEQQYAAQTFSIEGQMPKCAAFAAVAGFTPCCIATGPRSLGCASTDTKRCATTTFFDRFQIFNAQDECSQVNSTATGISTEIHVHRSCCRRVAAIRSNAGHQRPD